MKGYAKRVAKNYWSEVQLLSLAESAGGLL
jgi:hypothetical protein